jgi:hypothetical protein
MNIRSIDQAPTANDYLKALECEESSRDFRPVAAGTLRLMPGGLLQVGDETLEIVDEARTDLAKLARIPGSYFAEIKPDLRAVNFNARLPQFHGADEALEVTVSNDNAVHRVQRPRFGQLRASLAVEALLEARPARTLDNPGNLGCLAPGVSC